MLSQRDVVRAVVQKAESLLNGEWLETVSV